MGKNQDAEIIRLYTEYAAKSDFPGNSLNINLSDRDLHKIKEMANQAGFSYKKLILTIIHNFVEGKITIR